MKKCTIYIDGWQIQCCGDRFKVGEFVKWRVENYNKRIEQYEAAGEFDYYYENHPMNSDGYFTFTGIVVGIDIIFARFVPDPSQGEKVLICSDTFIQPTKEAAIWIKDEREYKFDGYIVHFEDYQIYPEEKDEEYPDKMRYMNLDKIEEGFNNNYPEEVLTGLIQKSGGILTKDLIRKKFTVDVLRNLVGGDPFYYFDDDSYEKLDLKIETLSALRNGTAPKDIPKYSEIFELLPDDVQILD